MTSSDTSDHNGFKSINESTGSNPSSEFKSQLRADAQEFKPTFRISTPSIQNVGVYYHGVLPAYSRIVEYDGYRIGNVMYNKNSKSHMKSESQKVSTSLNPNAQEFVPRRWVNSCNEEQSGTIEVQKKTIQTDEQYTLECKPSLEGQIRDLSLNVEDHLNHVQPEAIISYKNEEISCNEKDVLDASENQSSETDEFLVSRESDPELYESQLRDDPASTTKSQIKLIDNESLQQPAYFTFKDKLLACVSSKTTSTSNNTTQKVVNSDKNQSIIKNTSDSNNVDDVKDQKQDVNDNGNSWEDANKPVSEDNKNAILTRTTETIEMSENKKLSATTGVSWAQRLKNSTSTQNSRKAVIEVRNSEGSSSRIDSKHISAVNDGQDICKTFGFGGPVNYDLAVDPQNKCDDTPTDNLGISSNINEVNCSTIAGKLSLDGAVVNNDVRSECSEMETSGKSSESALDIKFSSQVHVDSSDEPACSLTSLNEEKQTEDTQNIAKQVRIPITYSSKIPIFILLALREVSMDFKNLETTYVPPELSRRNLAYKEGDRDGYNRGRGGWTGSINSGVKSYNRDGSNVFSGGRRERYQNLSGLNSQSGKRIYDIPGNSQSSTLDWTRDERRMFRLESSAESWIVKQKEQKINGDQFENQLRQYRAILNKLTVEKFDKLFDQIISVGINNEEEMIGLLKLVFDKATTQHHFIPMYVQLCDKLRDHIKDTTTIETRRILVDLCQELFVENLSEMVLPESIQGNEEDSFEWQLKYKNKMKGNMIFMASLVRKRVIASTVVLMCMEELLQFHLPHHLEALCVFLHHVGPFLDSEKWKHFDDFNTLFHQFEDFASNEDVPIRIRFLIKDVIDSRKNNWKSKNAKEGPMMLDDLKLKINAERGESGNPSGKLENASIKSQNTVPFRVIDKNSIYEQNARISGSPLNAWQKQSISLSSGKAVSVANSSSDSSHKGEHSQKTNKSDVDLEDTLEDSEHLLPEGIKNSVCGLMDSFVASYDIDEFFLNLNDLNIPPIYFVGVYKSMFIRIAEYRVNQRNALFKAFILSALRNKEYMDGESAKAGILLVLQPSVLNDILIDVPQFKDIVSIEFIRDAISEFDSKGEVFNSAFIEQAESLLN